MGGAGWLGPSMAGYDLSPYVWVPGAIHLEFQASGNHYVWRKSTSTVHNIIVGKLWIDQVRGCPRGGAVGPGRCQPLTTPSVCRQGTLRL